MTELFSCNLRDGVTIEAIEEALMNEEKGKGRALSFFNKEARNSELLQDYSGDDLYHLLDAMTLISEWGNNKQVFQVDDDFIRELLNTDEIFYEKDSWKYLPYKCFYLDISESNELCRDFQCKGIFVKTQFFMSAGKERVMLRAYRVNEERFFGDAYEFGNESDSIGLSKLPDVRYEKVVLNGVTTELESHVQKMAKLLLQILNYLSSVEPDIKENEETQKTYRKPQPNAAPKNKYSEIRKWDVGVRFGVAYRTWQKDKSENECESSGVHRAKHNVRPHSRKAHWSHFWYGSGENKVRRAKWISECFVGMKNGKEPVVIHKCEGKRGEVE